MLRTYTLANGATVFFYDSDFDRTVYFGGHGYKHSKAYGFWFDCETRKEVTDESILQSAKLRCVDGNANCYKNITPDYFEEERLVFRRMVEKASYSDRFDNNCYKHRIHAHLIPEIQKIIVNDKTTIVLWEDDTKTIVRPSAKDNYDLEAAVCAAIAKKIYGSNSAFKRMIKEKVVVQENKKKEKKEEENKKEDPKSGPMYPYNILLEKF